MRPRIRPLYKKAEETWKVEKNKIIPMAKFHYISIISRISVVVGFFDSFSCKGLKY